jgi:ribosome-associated protein
MAGGYARSCDDGTVRNVEITGDMIRLGQFLKLADLVGSGADAKRVLAIEEVTVNGEVELRRGRQLVRGDVVALGPEEVVVG